MADDQKSLETTLAYTQDGGAIRIYVDSDAVDAALAEKDAALHAAQEEIGRLKAECQRLGDAAADAKWDLLP